MCVVMVIEEACVYDAVGREVSWRVSLTSAQYIHRQCRSILVSVAKPQRRRWSAPGWSLRRWSDRRQVALCRRCCEVARCDGRGGVGAASTADEWVEGCSEPGRGPSWRSMPRRRRRWAAMQTSRTTTQRDEGTTTTRVSSTSPALEYV